MITTISKWGNSQGVRIPSDILKLVGYSVGDEVEVTTDDRGVLIQKRTKHPEQLKAAGMVKKYVKRHITDKEMETAWRDAAAEKWNEKNR